MIVSAVFSAGKPCFTPSEKPAVVLMGPTSAAQTLKLKRGIPGWASPKTTQGTDR
jgi:hypothetical protein